MIIRYTCGMQLILYCGSHASNIFQVLVGVSVAWLDYPNTSHDEGHWQHVRTCTHLHAPIRTQYPLVNSLSRPANVWILFSVIMFIRHKILYIWMVWFLFHTACVCCRVCWCSQRVWNICFQYLRSCRGKAVRSHLRFRDKTVIPDVGLGNTSYLLCDYFVLPKT